MARTKYKPEQVIPLLREAEVEIEQGRHKAVYHGLMYRVQYLIVSPRDN